MIYLLSTLTMANPAKAAYYNFIRVENNSDGVVTASLYEQKDGNKVLIESIKPVTIAPDTTENLGFPETVDDIEWERQNPLSDLLDRRYIKIDFADGTSSFFCTAYLNTGSYKMDVEVTKDRKINEIGGSMGPNIDANERQKRRKAANAFQDTIHNFLDSGEGADELPDDAKRFLLIGALMNGHLNVVNALGLSEQQIQEAQQEVSALKQAMDQLGDEVDLKPELEPMDRNE